MDIELVTIGTELLLGFTIDTNAAELGRTLAEHGIRVARHTTVDDDPARLRAVVGEAVARSGVVVTTGGLGPTRDDISREVIADLLGMPLRFDAQVWSAIGERFRRLGRELPESNRPQAMVPAGGTVIPNRWGTAPGLWLEHARGVVVMLPGVPIEMRNLLRHEVLPRLVVPGDGRGSVILSRTLRTAGIGESALAERVGRIEESLAPLTLAYLPQMAGVDLRVTAWQLDEADAERRLEDAVARLRGLVGDWCYGEGEEELAEKVLALLRTRGRRLAVAESCTGGMLGARLTDIPGSSDVFVGGVLAYANEAKVALLDVAPVILERHGAVSEECAAAMAEGAARRLGADVAVSITGIAGPGGGTADKPVGTVCIGYHLAGDTDVVRAGFPGTRPEVRERAVVAAMMGLRRRLQQ